MANKAVLARRKAGDLQVWWIPQIGMGKQFEVDVATVADAAKLIDVLANYDLFQLHNKIKPDYSNAGGLRRWCDDSDGDGTPGWEDWYDDASGEDDPRKWVAAQSVAAPEVIEGLALADA